MDKKIAGIAAKWWADFLRTNAPLDNGDESEIGALTIAMAKLLQDSENARGQKSDADKFEESLSETISKIETDYLTLSVDYRPDYYLMESAKRAGLNLGMLGMTRLPWKTVMWIEPQKIIVRIGYRGASQIIYPAEENNAN